MTGRSASSWASFSTRLARVTRRRTLASAGRQQRPDLRLEAPAEAGDHRRGDLLGPDAAREEVGVGEEVALEVGRRRVEVGDPRRGARGREGGEQRVPVGHAGPGERRGRLAERQAFDHGGGEERDLAAAQDLQHLDRRRGAAEAVFAGAQRRVAEAMNQPEPRPPGFRQHPGGAQPLEDRASPEAGRDLDEDLVTREGAKGVWRTVHACRASPVAAVAGEQHDDEQAQGPARAAPHRGAPRRRGRRGPSAAGRGRWPPAG